MKDKKTILYSICILIFLLLSILFWSIFWEGYFAGRITLLSSKDVGKHYYKTPESYIGLIEGITEIDESHIEIDTVLNRQILGNLVNIALKGTQKNVLQFAVDFKSKYPSTDYELVYLDTVINRVQVRLPQEKRTIFKQDVKQKLNNYSLLVWDEYLFRNQYATNDPLLKSNDKWYLDRIGIDGAWKKTLGSKDIVIAVIDNGFDLQHEELKDKSIKPYNVITKSNDVRANKQNHGTHVAATAVGNANNGSGLAGTCPNCTLMPIKVEDENGYMASSYIIDGILYAIKNKADVINLSLGFTRELTIPELLQKQIISHMYKDEEAFWEQLFSYAEEQNVLCVIAAGNSSILTGVDPFTRSRKTIKVGATDSFGNLAEFTNFGEYTTLFAPGVAIKSAKPNNQYEYLDGTSMATPVVSGFVGLLKSTNSTNNEDIRKLLLANTEKINSINHLKFNTL